MSTEGLLVSLIISLFGIAWVLLPLLPNNGIVKTDSQTLHQQYSDLKQRYAQVLTTIRDLDEDHSTAKILADEYAHERRRWAHQGVNLLKEIERLEADHPSVLEPVNAANGRSIDDTIEAAVARYRDQTVTES